MRQLGNLLWYFPGFGFIHAILAFILGTLLTLTVVAAPIGMGLIEFSKFLLAPFSYSMISKSEYNIEQNKAWKAYSTVVTLLYLPLGLLLAVGAAINVFLLGITFIGLPVALVIAKSIKTFVNPVNKKCVPVGVAQELERRKAEDQTNKLLEKTHPSGNSALPNAPR